MMNRPPLWLAGGLRLLLLLLVLHLQACGAATDVLAVPLELPFAVDRGDERLEQKIRVLEKQTYSFGLSFYFTAAPGDSQRVLKLVGDSVRNDVTGIYVNLGEPLTVRLRIQPAGSPSAPPSFDRIESRTVYYATREKSFDKLVFNCNVSR